jgi:hypothetical protein
MSRVVAILALLLAFSNGFADSGNPEPVDSEPGGGEPEKTKPWYKNIVPVPTIITEPAIGEGLAIGLGYFHPAKPPVETGDGGSEQPARKPPPTVSGVFGGATNNGTWAVGVGHKNSWKNDTVRYLGVAAYANVVMDFYLLDRPFEFTLKGLYLLQDLRFRLAESNWFLGAALSYLDGTSRFEINPPASLNAEPDQFLALDFNDVGFKGRLMFENRDDTMMPSSGRLFDLAVTAFRPDLGGDYDYTTMKAKLISFHALNERFVLGWRGEYSTVSGDPPFYGIPWVSLRGIPAMRFQGRDVAVAEVEARFNFNKDWAAIGFFGRGWTDLYQPEMDSQESIRAHGVGARYRMLKEQGVWVGIDLAKGPEDTVYYVQVGHAW